MMETFSLGQLSHRIRGSSGGLALPFSCLNKLADDPVEGAVGEEDHELRPLRFLRGVLRDDLQQLAVGRRCVGVHPLRRQVLDDRFGVEPLLRLQFFRAGHRSQINFVRQRQRAHKGGLQDFCP